MGAACSAPDRVVGPPREILACERSVCSPRGPAARPTRATVWAAQRSEAGEHSPPSAATAVDAASTDDEAWSTASDSFAADSPVAPRAAQLVARRRANDEFYAQPPPGPRLLAWARERLSEGRESPVAELNGDGIQSHSAASSPRRDAGSAARRPDGAEGGEAALSAAAALHTFTDESLTALMGGGHQRSEAFLRRVADQIHPSERQTFASVCRATAAATRSLGPAPPPAGRPAGRPAAGAAAAPAIEPIEVGIDSLLESLDGFPPTPPRKSCLAEPGSCWAVRASPNGGGAGAGPGAGAGRRRRSV